MPLLAFRLHAPMASWGDHRAGVKRRTSDRAPGRSALLGLLGAALGIVRSDREGLERLSSSALFAVASHGPRVVTSEFRTIQTVPESSTRLFRKNNPVAPFCRGALLNWLAPRDRVHTLTQHHDSVCEGLWRIFVATRPGAEISLNDLRSALLRPRFHLYLGRREFPPTIPLDPQILEDAALDQALESYAAIPGGSDGDGSITAASLAWMMRQWGDDGGFDLSWDNSFPVSQELAQASVRTESRAEPVCRERWVFTTVSAHSMRAETQRHPENKSVDFLNTEWTQ